ncbi:hypothetical protein KIW84_014232 [Lathyrus oleraceus]|uniref:Uncharacterized protein n=2 Tax=Pisum sativum TaxID=3888 RepID=A0A9D5BMS0_PEA|nr:hypothetical protein KIW84_014232 [Pisum sativum]
MSFYEANAHASQGLAFTLEQHKALLDLLQGSSQLQSHSINHPTSQPDLGSSVICTLRNSFQPKTFILYTSATDHDLSFKNMIGTAELHGGLYLLTSPLVTLHNTPPDH